MKPPDFPDARWPQWVVVWRVWESCSLACKFCGYSRELPWPRMSASRRDLLSFGRVLSDVQTHTGGSILVSWLGGEPFAWKELPELASLYRRRFGLRLGVTTNGIPLVSQEIRRSLLAHYEQVTISIDGFAEFHDQVRGQSGLFEQLRENVSALREEDRQNRLWRRVNIVLMRGNIDSFADFAHEMAAWGFHELTLNQLGGNERPEFYPANRLLPSQVERFARELPQLRTELAERGMLISGGDYYLERIQATTSGEPIAIHDCHPGTEFLFIDTQGRLSPCSFSSAAYGIPLAEIQSAEQLLELPKRFRALRRQRHLPACDDCHATHVFDKFERPRQLMQLTRQDAT
jgi:MoaA/NifB/PqqE/SkfB family radical SAM enzyme